MSDLKFNPVPPERSYSYFGANPEELEAPQSPKPKGRPRIHEDPKEAKRERDRKYRERKKAEAGKAPKSPAQGSRQISLDEEIASLANEYKSAGPSKVPPRVDGEEGSKAESPSTASPKASDGPPMVTGFILLAFMDAVMPMAVDMVMKRFRKRSVKDIDALRMTEGEREAIEPLADKAAEYILAKVHPVALFLGASFFITYGKAMSAASVPVKQKGHAS